MVNYDQGTLNSVFGALGDATRRAIVSRLANKGELSVSALAEPFAVSLPAILKHLNILDRAGLIRREKRGRTVFCRLDRAPLDAADHWLRDTERFWDASLDRLEHFLEEQP